MAPEIEMLATLASVEEIRDELDRLARQYGCVNSVICLPPGEHEDGFVAGFLVNFKTTRDAMNASAKWNCRQYGLSSVIVPIRRKINGKLL